jgi:hypothetical protein
MYAQQSFSKTEVENLCNRYLDNLYTVEKRVLEHFKLLETRCSWWPRLTDPSEDRSLVFGRLERWKVQATELRYFAKANTGMITPSPLLLDADTYTSLTRCSDVIFNDLIADL